MSRINFHITDTTLVVIPPEPTVPLADSEQGHIGYTQFVHLAHNRVGALPQNVRVFSDFAEGNFQQLQEFEAS